MFYKIGFWILLVVLIGCGYLFMSTNPMKRVGAMSWIDIYSTAPEQTAAFLDQNFGIKVVDTTDTGGNGDYRVIKTSGQMFPFAGIMGLPTEAGADARPGVMMYLTVKNYAEAAAKLKANGAIAQTENHYAGGMLFGVYEIPGGVVIGICEYVEGGPDADEND